MFDEFVAVKGALSCRCSCVDRGLNAELQWAAFRRFVLRETKAGAKVRRDGTAPS